MKKSISSSKARRSASSVTSSGVDRPPGVEGRLAGRALGAPARAPRRGSRSRRRGRTDRPRCRRTGRPRDGAGRLSRPRSGSRVAVTQAARRKALGQDERPDGVALHLDARLLAHAREARRGRALEGRSHRQGKPAERGAGRDVPRPQRRPLMGRDAGHQREVVRLAAPRLAVRPPATDLAVLDRVRPRGRRVLGGSRGALREGLELAPDRPDVGGVVGDAQVIHVPGAAAERHVHQLRPQALESGELLRVQAQLEHAPSPWCGAPASCPRPRSSRGPARSASPPGAGSRRSPATGRRRTRPGR